MSRDRVDKPYVAIDKTYMAIVLFTARKYVFFVTYERGICVKRSTRESFEESYKPFFVVTHPDNRKVEAPPEQGGKPYD